MDGQSDPQGVRVVHLPRDLSIESVSVLWRSLVGAVDDGTPRLALGMADVVDLSGAALGVLVKTCKHARQAGGDVRLFAVPRPLTRFLDAMGLDAVFQVYGKEQEAVDSFREQNPPSPSPP